LFAPARCSGNSNRGRIYIRFGPPDEIDDHSSPGYFSNPHSFSYIDWTYRYLEGIGNNVKIEFADPTGTHEFRMTSDPNPGEAHRYVNPNPH
jgi:hypothetical protein